MTEIAMGQNHMLAIGYDRLSMVNDDKDSLLRYAINVLEPLRLYLYDQGKIIYKRKNPLENVLLVKERQLVELALIERFEDDRPRWPMGQWKTLINMLFSDVRLQFKNDTHEILERM